MKLTFTKQAPYISKPGKYLATLNAVDQRDGKFGQQLAWTFIADEGEQQGHRAVYVTGTTLSADNMLGRLADMLLGREIAVAENVELFDCIGQQYTITCVPGDDGGAVIDKVEPYVEN